MRKSAALFVCLLCLPAVANADPFVTSARIITTGIFSCNRNIPCSGEGTSTLSVGSGTNTATLTFRGVDETFLASSAGGMVPLGEFEFTAPDGFVVPGINPNRWVVGFTLNYQQTMPAAASSSRRILFGVAGQPYFQWLEGGNHFSTPVGPNPFNYTLIVYTMPYPLRIHPNEVTPFTAEVGVVPEPATMVLLGTGLAGAALARRRRPRPEGDDEIATPSA